MEVAGSAKINIEIPEQEKDQSIQRWVSQVLRTNIIKLRLRPAQLISENEISDALHTSRTPVREAFIRLAEDGLLKITPQKRTVVSPINLQQAEEARFIRRAIEKAVLKEACGSLRDPDTVALRASIDRQVMCRKAGAHDLMLATDNEFHRTIFRGCGKERSWLYIERLDYNYDRLRIMALPHVIEEVIEEHRKILDAIAEGRVEIIDALVDAHMSWKAIDRVIRECPPEYLEGGAVGGAPAPARTAPALEPRDTREDGENTKGGIAEITTVRSRTKH